jgi:hypothetical protein
MLQEDRELQAVRQHDRVPAESDVVPPPVPMPQLADSLGNVALWILPSGCEGLPRPIQVDQVLLPEIAQGSNQQHVLELVSGLL